MTAGEQVIHAGWNVIHAHNRLWRLWDDSDDDAARVELAGRHNAAVADLRSALTAYERKRCEGDDAGADEVPLIWPQAFAGAEPVPVRGFLRRVLRGRRRGNA